MLSKRKEPFRYTFEEPIDCSFEITGINEQEVSSSKGEAKIINLSPNGVKLLTSLEIPLISNKTIFLTIAFKLNEKAVVTKGEIVWIKQRGKQYEYGLDLSESEDIDGLIIEQLKEYVRQTNNKSEENK